jgi:peptide/nickel transport system permease protein
MNGLARRVMRRPAAVASTTWLGLVLVTAVGAPLFAPHGPLDQDLNHVLSDPSSGHLLGTDELGRDILSRLLYGGQSTLLGVVEALLVYLVLGVTFGLAAGYLGGWVDWVVTRTAELMFALPGIIIVLVVLSVFPSNLSAAMITFGVLGAPGLIRLLRAQTLSLAFNLAGHPTC